MKTATFVIVVVIDFNQLRTQIAVGWDFTSHQIRPVEGNRSAAAYKYA